MPEPHRRREHLPRPRGLPGRLQPAAPGQPRGRASCSTRLGHPRDLADPLGRPAVPGRAADRQHGAGAVPRHPAAHPRRAVGGARPGGGAQPVPGHPRASPPRAWRSSTSPTGSRRSAQIGDRITVLKDGRTVATGLAARGHPDLRADPADDRPLDRVRLPAARPRRPRDRGDVGPRGARPGAGRRVQRRRPHRPRRRDRRPRRPGRRRPLGDPRDGVRRPPGHARAPSPSTASTLRRGSVTAAVAAGVGLAPEERKSQGLLLDQAVYRNITVSSLEPVLPRRLPQQRGPSGAAPRS